MTKEEQAMLHELVNRKADELLEHFDTVLIICAKGDNGQTFTQETGLGNPFAILGQVDIWLATERMKHRKLRLARMENPPDNPHP